MTAHTDVALKLALGNHLLLYNEHRVISFQFFRSFDYSTMDLFEVSKQFNPNLAPSCSNVLLFQFMTHSLSLVFLIAPLIQAAQQN